jgi:hypothetical protein
VTGDKGRAEKGHFRIERNSSNRGEIDLDLERKNFKKLSLETILFPLLLFKNRFLVLIT